MFDLACTDPHSTAGVDESRADSGVPRYLIDLIQQMQPDRQLAYNTEAFDLRSKAPHELARAQEVLAKFCVVDPEPAFEIEAAQADVLLGNVMKLASPGSAPSPTHDQGVCWSGASC